MVAVPLRSAELTPAQQAVLDALGAGGAERPRFDAGLGAALRAELEEGVAGVEALLDALEIDQLFVAKHRLSSVLGCEVRFMAEDGAPFPGWTVPLARGKVAHRAIELAINVRGEPLPGELVDHALARLSESEDNLGEWVAALPELDRAALRGEAIERVSMFLDSWPPLRTEWRPRTEVGVRVELLDARVVLSGRVDLALGRAEGQVAGRVLIDLKTGGFTPSHLDDLRFYALLEAIRIGVPPRRIATQYLDSGRLVPEDVTVGLLAAAARRTVDAIERLLLLRAGHRTPLHRPGPSCRWCPVLAHCEPGRAHLGALDDA